LPIPYVRKEGALVRGQNTTRRSVVENGCSELFGADRGCMKLNGAELAQPVQPRRAYKYIGSLAKPETQQEAMESSSCNPPQFQRFPVCSVSNDM